MPNYTTYNIKMVKGDTESFGFEVTGIDSLDTAFFSCKRNSQDANYLFQKSLGAGITQSAESRYIVRIAPEDTQSLAPGQYWYDLEIGKDGDIFTILRGVLELVPEITEPNAVVYTSVDWGNIVGNIQNQSDLQAALNAKATTSSLAQVATTGSYDDLTDTPSIPTKTSELTNDSDFVVESSLAAVATSGSYSDLLNRPTALTDLAGVLPVNQGGTGKTSGEVLTRFLLYVTPSVDGTMASFALSDSIMNYKVIGVNFVDPTHHERRGYVEFSISQGRTQYALYPHLILYAGPDQIAVVLSTFSFEGTQVTFENKRMYRISSSFSSEDKGIAVIDVYGYK